MNARVLITGAAGFIGANLTRHLAREGFEVTGLIRPGGTPWRLAEELPRVRLVECDLCSGPALRDAVGAARPEVIFHLATHGAYPQQRDVVRMLETSCVGTAHLLEAARAAGVRTIVYAGSSGEYGFHAGPIDEATPLDPNSYYAVGKAAGALLLRYAATVHPGLRIRIVRFFSVYGEWEGPTRLFPQLVVNGLRGRLPRTLGNPDSARDFVHVRDAVHALVAAWRSDTAEPGAVFNIGAGLQISLRELVELARNRFGLSVEPRWNTHLKAPWETQSWVADVSKAAAVLGWRPTVPIEVGFDALVKWFTAHPQTRGYYEVRQAPEPAAAAR